MPVQPCICHPQTFYGVIINEFDDVAMVMMGISDKEDDFLGWLAGQVVSGRQLYLFSINSEHENIVLQILFSRPSI